MSEKQFQSSIAIMCFAMVSIVAGAWVLHAVTVPEPPTAVRQLTT